MKHTDAFTTTMAFNRFDKTVRTGSGRYVVQVRHEDGKRWVDVKSFASRKDARAAIDHVIAQGHGHAESFRIRKVFPGEAKVGAVRHPWCMA